MDAPRYDDEYVRDLFDRMGPSYHVMNVVSSFGFSELWRRTCVYQAGISQGSRVCEMMAGSGECWKYLAKSTKDIVSIDFSSFMVERQRHRNRRYGESIDVRQESATATSLAGNSCDTVISAFGLKTLSAAAVRQFADEVFRILKPGGKFSLLVISVPSIPILKPLYSWYLKRVIPMVGRVFLGDIECYRTLGNYTQHFGSCQNVVGCFSEAGLEVRVQSHFFGCASSLVGCKKS